MPLNFEHHLKKEIYKNEIIRTTLILIISLLFLVGFNVITNFSKDKLLESFKSFNAIYIASGIMLFLAIREFIIRLILNRRKIQNSLPWYFRYINVFCRNKYPFGYFPCIYSACKINRYFNVAGSFNILSNDIDYYTYGGFQNLYIQWSYRSSGISAPYTLCNIS